MNYPFEKFIIFRILRGDTKDELNASLTKLCLPEVDAESFTVCKDKTRLLGLPLVFKASLNKRNKTLPPQGAIDFLKFHGLDSLFALETGIIGYLKGDESDDLQSAWLFHEAPFVRMATNVLLFHKQPVGEIKDLLTAGHQFSISEKSIKIYQEYFFDTRKMKQEDWLQYVQKLQFREREVIFAALTNKLEDIKYLIKVPTNVEYSGFLKRALETANYKMNHYSSLNTDSGDRHARAWTLTGINAGEKYAKYSRGDAGDLMKQLHMEFASIDDGIDMLDPTIAADVLPKAAELNVQKDTQHVVPEVATPELFRDPNDV